MTKDTEMQAVPNKARLIDPDRCSVFGGNGRADVIFDAKLNASLVEDIKNNGQVMSVMARPCGDNRFEVVAGSRRLGAVLAIRKERPGLMLRAVVCELTDEEAWKIADKENADRRDLTPIQCARTWAYAIATFHDGCQKTFAETNRLAASKVSRTLRLLELPTEVMALLRNPETVSVHFATEFFKFCSDDEKIEDAREFARNHSVRGKLYSASALLDVLCLDPSEREAQETEFVPFSGIEKHAAIKTKRDGATHITIKNVVADRDNLAARKALVKSIMSELTKRLTPELTKSSQPKNKADTEGATE